MEKLWGHDHNVFFLFGIFLSSKWIFVTILLVFLIIGDYRLLSYFWSPSNGTKKKEEKMCIQVFMGIWTWDLQCVCLCANNYTMPHPHLKFQNQLLLHLSNQTFNFRLLLSGGICWPKYFNASRVSFILVGWAIINFNKVVLFSERASVKCGLAACLGSIS